MKEEDFIPFQTSDIPEGPYLVFSPHPDDEAFGMGGTIALAAQQKIDVHVAVLTDGSQQGSSEERKAEARAAASVLGITQIDFWDIKDRELNKANLLELGFLQLIENVKPKCVFIPSSLEYHPDHRAAHILLLEALDQTGYRDKIWAYEITRHGEANHLIDITSVFETKKKAITCFKSQLLKRNYLDFTVALNRSRALTLPETVMYAEAFLSLEKEKALLDIEFGTRKYLMDASGSKKQPLVSVIVRTKDRPHLLTQALISIADQTYPKMETIVINDGGCDVIDIIEKFRQELPEIRYVNLEQNIGRSAAANQGIEASKGEWIAFLDDDDLMTTTSIGERLAYALKSGREVVYGAVECHHYKRDSEDSPYVVKNKFLYNYPFDRDVMLFQNLIPLNSILFHKDVFDRYGLFDESYELYEDWEYLIRISRSEDFFFVSTLVGIYRIFTHATMTGGRFSEEKKSAHEKKIFKKYLAQNISQKRIQKYLNFHIQERTRNEMQLAHDNEILRGRLHQVMTSKSWRLTQPIRDVAAILKKVFFYIKSHSAFDDEKRANRKKKKEILEKLSGKRPINNLKSTHKCRVHSINPLITIIMNTGSPHPEHLREKLDSVLGQCYIHWELYAARVASKDSAVGKILDEYEKKDSRIRIFQSSEDENGDMADFYNETLSTSSGDFVVFLGPEDSIMPNALCEVTRLINKHPDADMIYADENRISKNGKFTNELYKPGWSPDTFLSNTYTGQFGIYRRSMVMEAGKIRKEFDGAQFFDLGLRISERSKNIHHIPLVLSSHRKSSSTPFRSSRDKTHLSQAGLKAIEEALSRRNAKGTVEPVKGFPDNFIVHYELRDNPLISIIIATKDNPGYLDLCLSSIFWNSDYKNFEVILVDNNSSEERTFKIFQKWKQFLGFRIKIESLNIPFNFSKINNFGVSHAQGEIILLLNNDTEVLTPFWLERMAGYAQQDEIGAVGATLLYPDKTIQHSGVVLNPEFIAGHLHKGLNAKHPGYLSRLKTVFNHSAVTGACLMVRKKLYQEIDGFDENLAVAFNDVDFCLKLLESGYRNVVLPYVRLKHHESKTRGPEDTPEKQKRFEREKGMMLEKWKEYLLNDPYYNPNLAQIGEYFNIKD